MSYQNKSPDRMDELRFHSQQSPRNETSLLGMVSSPSDPQLQQPTQSQYSRSGMVRRFTTDSGRAPTISSITSQRGGPDVDYGSSTFHKIQLLEKKKVEYERIREQKRKFESEMKILEVRQRREEQELAQMQEDLGRTVSNPSHQSEPKTPPEYQSSTSGFPSAFARPNRYSNSSLSSPPASYTQQSRSGSQITSPPSCPLQSRLMDDKLQNSSVSDSLKNIGDDDKAEAVRQDPTSHRSTNALNRYSMPVTKSRTGLHEMQLDQTNTARFLFGEEEVATTSTRVDDYLQRNTNKHSFPILVRQDNFSDVLSASSAALDLALSKPSAPATNGWSTFANRHRTSRSQHVIPLSATQPSGPTISSNFGVSDSTASARQSYRHSLDMKYRQSFDAQLDNVSHVTSPASNSLATPPKLQSSFSTCDISNSRNGTNSCNTTNTTPKTHAQLHLHNHNASLGRIPPGAVNNRMSRELTQSEREAVRECQNSGFPSIQSALHANAPPFGPALSQSISQNLPSTPISPTSQTFCNQQPYYNSMQMMMSGMQNVNLGQPMYSSLPYAYNGGQIFAPSRPQQTTPRDSQARVIQQRRQPDGEAMNRFANLSLESLGGEIYALCKDQHGCRFLQKKLEERNPEEIHQIWLETNQHVIELMTDPFGNYLCQKLLEYCNDEERTILIKNASHDLVRIALNQHGTRALQKMIEHITTPTQIDTIINALRYRVVELIQDLNGNHVIQKCLNKLTPQHAQFIFDAVGTHCVDVGTHRHGCCVLQRCIDHADGEQKAWLIRQISNNAYVLVQDPFGNYVVQYILDLNEHVFTEPLVAMFKGRVSQLSKQKFSSNVIEKCLRCAQEPSKDMLIEEMLQPSELDRLLRDSFANYVIQTALDYANPAMKSRLVEAIRPYLPAIRTTPYGRRIQAKIQGNEGRSVPNGGTFTPNEQAEPVQAPLRHQRGGSTASASNSMTPGNFAGNYSVPGPSSGNLISGRALQQANPFPSSEQLASPTASHPPYSYPYIRSANQPGNGNWL
ncbi:Pumilio domain-containing protein [Podosphaera aphanis]|nr:Pumilio domain-containing protein [Podosphaera aphanis]